MEKQSLQQFGATIKTKYPQYQDMSDEELGSKMLAKYPQYQDMIQTESPVNRDEGAFEKMMGSKGLFDIPVAGGIARGIAHPLLKGAEITAEGVNSGIDMAKNLPKIMAGEGLPAYEPKFVSPATYENLSGDLPTATTEALRSGAGAAASFLPGLNVAKGGVGASVTNSALTGATRGAMIGADQGEDFNPGMMAGFAAGGAILEPLAKLLTSGKMTQKGVNRLMDEAKKKSSETGASTTWDEVSARAMETLQQGKNQFKPELVKAVNKILATKTPAATLTNVETGASKAAPAGWQTAVLKSPTLDANSLHALRQALDDSIPKNSWNNPNINPTAVEANMIVRNIVSDALHEIAPDTKLLDAINHIYYNPLIKGTKIGPLKAQWSDAMTGVPSAIANTGLGAGALWVGNKLLRN